MWEYLAADELQEVLSLSISELRAVRIPGTGLGALVPVLIVRVVRHLGELPDVDRRLRIDRQILNHLR